MNGVHSFTIFCQKQSKEIKILWESLKMEISSLTLLTQDVILVHIFIQAVWLLTQSKSNVKRYEVHNFLLWLKNSLEHLMPFLVKTARDFWVIKLSYLMKKNFASWRITVFGIKCQINQHGRYVEWQICKGIFESWNLFPMYPVLWLAWL